MLRKGYADPNQRRRDYERVEACPEQSAPTAENAPSTVSDLIAAASGLTKPPDFDRLRGLVGALVTMQLEPPQERQILDAINHAAGVGVATLREQIKLARQRFGATGSVDRDPVAPVWTKQLRQDLLGQMERNEANVITALSNDPAFAGAIVFDEFRQECMIISHCPGRSGKAAASLDGCR